MNQMKGGKREHRPVARWPCPGDTLLVSLLRADLYSEILSTYLQSGLRVHKTEKKGDSNIPVRNGRARAVLWRRRIGKSSGVSGGDVYGQIRVFRAQRIPVPYIVICITSTMDLHLRIEKRVMYLVFDNRKEER